MRRGAIGMTGSKLATLGLALLLGAGLAGCKSDGGKTSAPAPSGTSTPSPTPAPTPGTGGTVVPPPTNGSPTIAGSTVGTAKTTLPYSFQPTAIDPDGDTLTFSVQNPPDWATFDAATGRLEGTPPAGSSGALPVVKITVSDGQATASLELSLSVVDPVVGSATLAWQPPKTNVDGTPLYDLSGYVVRYGKSADNLDQSVRIVGGEITTCVVENLIEGTWYFTLAAVNSQGVESDPAGHISKTIG